MKKYDRRIYMIGVTTVIILLSVVLYLVFASRQKNMVLLNTQRIIAEQTKTAVDGQLDQVAKLAEGMMLSTYKKIQQSVDNGQLDIYRDLYSTIEQYEEIYEPSRITLYVPDDIFFSRGNKKISSLSSLLESEEGSCIKRNGLYWLVSKDDATKDLMLSCILVYSDVTDYNSLFTAIRIDLPASILEEFMYGSSSKSDYKKFLVDQEGHIIAGLGKKINEKAEVLPEAMTEVIAKVSGERPVTIAERSEIGGKYVSCARLSAGDCFVVILNDGDLGLEMKWNGTLGFACMAVLVLGGILFILVNTYNLAIDSSIQKLMEIAQAIESVNTPCFEQTEEKSPLLRVKNLRRSVDQTTHQVMQLIDQQYRNELELKNLQLRALQAQINPHFLYNTLDVIKWMIASGDSKESIRMINSLSRYFRFSLKKGRDIVCVREEVELTKAYIEIMEKRFEGFFQVNYRIEKECEECLLPKQTLQPIVENALIHGVLDTKRKGCIISIYAFLEETDLLIEVSDNGAGMDEETLGRLLSDTIHSGGYGLKNVKARLELFGGQNTRFHIESTQEVGTTVEIRLKAVYQS